jgi:hypothetical protein
MQELRRRLQHARGPAGGWGRGRRAREQLLARLDRRSSGRATGQARAEAAHRRSALPSLARLRPDARCLPLASGRRVRA